MAIPADPRAIRQRAVDRLPQADADVLGRVMAVDVQVSLASDRQVHERMAGEQLEHVVEKADSRRDLAPPLTVKIERQADVGFAGRPGDLGRSVRGAHVKFSLLRARNLLNRSQAASALAVQLAYGIDHCNA